MNRTIQNSKSLRGCLKLPGDKSISHRALLLAAFAEGTTEIRGLLRSDDVYSTWRCIDLLGARLEEENFVVYVSGLGKKLPKIQSSALPCGNSGTTLRLLMGILAAQPMAVTLSGDESLCRRPMARVATPLREMGALVQLTKDATAPVYILGKRPLHAIFYSLPVASAQVKSALLLAGLFADGTTTVTGQIQSRDHTERMLPQFGICLDSNRMTNGSTPSLAIQGGQPLLSTSIEVPGDFSSAAFWLGAALLVPGSEIEIHQLSLNPTRTGFLKALLDMGASIDVDLIREQPEPVGNIRIRSSNLTSIQIHPDHIPFLIDELPILAIVASQAHGTTVIRGAEELRRKESDRIETIATNLRAMGGSIETFSDGFSITGPTPLQGVFIDPKGDHRIAMAFSVAALIARGDTTIHEAECVSVSYPNFYQDLYELSTHKNSF